VAVTAIAVLIGSGGSAVLTGTAAGPPGDGRPEWVRQLERPAANPIGGLAKAPAPIVTSARSVPMAPAAYAFPGAARWKVKLAETKSGGAVRLAAADNNAKGTDLDVEVLGREAAARTGASGFVFTVSVPAGGKRKTELSVDYSSFALAYGAGYADRLRLAALPACAAVDPLPSGCRTVVTSMPSHNDRGAKTLTASAELVEGTNTFAVISAVEGETGTFAATPLSISGSWQVAPGSGEFNYSYPLGLPEPPAGSAPSVGLAYSSGSIDGLTINTNTQAGPTGLGWSDFANAFIERRYEPCILTIHTTDLCWKGENATISLAGLSGPLIPEDQTYVRWRVQSDPGWRVERLSGAAYTNIYQSQYWKVTGPDGTQYFFGYGHMPGLQTNSILAATVVPDHPGEPCRETGAGSCPMGWRWYLDRVVDPDGNVTSYVYERQTNWYAGVMGLFGHIGNTEYHPAAMLKHIFYGGRDWNYDQYAAHVEFGIENRCYYLVAVCPDATQGHTGFPDTPTDLICAQGAPCTVYAPAFFNTKRYSYVATQVKVGGEWRNVARYDLIHSFNMNNNAGLVWKLQLERIQHSAVAFGRSNAYPPTVFGYAFYDNRVDHDSDVWKAMRHNRLASVTNPFGGTTTITYGLNRFCDGGYITTPPPFWDRNVRDCFPQFIKEGDHLRLAVFYKWLVTSVAETPGPGQTPVTTTYQYEEDPAWAFDTGSFARDESEHAWSLWRGYGTVTVLKGGTKTRLRVFRGMNLDAKLVLDPGGGGGYIPALGRRQASVSTFDGTLSYVDHRALAGRVLEEQRLGALGGVANSILESRRHEYLHVPTLPPNEDRLIDPAWVGLASTTERVYGTPTTFRQRRSQTTYLGAPSFQPTKVLEEGWLDVTGDERCTITTYADNPTAGMFVYPVVNKLVAGSCASTNVLSHKETYYDSAIVLGAPPTRGNPTKQRTQIDSGRWSETLTDYDELGRPIRVTDPTGGITTTDYAVTAGAWTGQIPIRTTVTNALGHQTVTDSLPEFGVPRKVVDPNGNLTEYTYDEFGRLSAVWLPTEPLAFLYPSYSFTYDIANRAIRTQRLISDSRCCETAVFEESWIIYDGFWRERQTQQWSPQSGHVLVSETTYDDGGRVRDEMVEQAFPGTPGAYLDGGPWWLNHTRHLYDELGRENRTEWWRGNTVNRFSTTAFGVDAVTVTGPDGKRVRERVDGLGRTVAVDEFDGQAWVSSTYRYDLADRLKSVTDPAGNIISYTVNLAGWRTAQQDPDRGNATFTYDNAGRQATAVDARGTRIVSIYDKLGRQTERRQDSATGPLLAKWDYDTALRGKGKPHKQTSYTPGGQWVLEVTGYDIKGRPEGNKLTVPAGIPGLSGTYTFTQTYDRADRVRTSTLPAIGGLPAETITTEHSVFNLPSRMAGLEEYVWAVGMDERGRRTGIALGPKDANGSIKLGRHWSYDADQRLAGSEMYLSGSGPIVNHQYTFDPAGNLKEKLVRLQGQTWRECFGYDPRNRLTSAHTVASTTTCASGTPNTGDRPYAHAYAYSADGRTLSRTASGVMTTYTYPVAGSVRPHAPQQIGAASYTWDAAGNMATRTASGGTETFTWNAENRLASVTGPAGATTYVYDADGNRLLRRTPDGRSTLYVAGHEVTVNASGTVVSAVRPYTFDGILVATRSLTGVSYLAGDEAGSLELSTTSAGAPAGPSRSYLPYGAVRAEVGGDFATERGFVGQIEDGSTGLSYLNARYYDAGNGLFVSTDPVYDTSKPKTLNPYGYSMNNPTSFSDPGGEYSVYTYGLERENAALREQNKQLIAHIGELGNHIEELQDVIRKQQSDIKKLLTYIGVLEAEIARQASIIRQLQARVAYLQRVVWLQQREISKLRLVVAKQQSFIRKQAAQIRSLGAMIGYYRSRLLQATVLKHTSVSRTSTAARNNPVPRLSGARGVRVKLAGYDPLGGGSDGYDPRPAPLESLDPYINGSTESVGGWKKVCLGLLWWICGRIALPKPEDTGPPLPPGGVTEPPPPWWEPETNPWVLEV